MRRLVGVCIAMLLLGAQGLTGGAATQAAFQAPPNAVPGSTSQRQAAFARVGSTGQSTAFSRFRARLAVPGRSTPSSGTQVAGASVGRVAASGLTGAGGFTFSAAALASTASAATSGAAPSAIGPRPSPSLTCCHPIPFRPPDADHDGIRDDTEAALANEFVPFYHVSSGEADVFATFQNQPTLAIQQLFSASPPISYYRVTPVGFVTASNGQQFAFAQIDYLTLWNADDGLQIGDLCAALTAGLGFSLDGLQGHEFDEEHSEVLVGAPVSSLGQFPTDGTTYLAYDFYRAAHEGTFFDHSSYLTPTSPIPPNNHINYWLSLSKHSTYEFNPDFLPMFPDAVIAASYATVDGLFADGLISIDTYLALLYALDTVFFTCVVEHFSENAALDAYPNQRINVGELGTPLNGSAWINDPRIQQKLTPLYWQIV